VARSAACRRRLTASPTLELRGSYDNIAPLSRQRAAQPAVGCPLSRPAGRYQGDRDDLAVAVLGKYAGYAIEKGKLSLFVKYKIENKQLTAENRVFLDQLTFGEAVDSPDATKLPVTLAVALLKNQNGEIDINLPIAGSLDDPQFSIGGLVVKVIVNLLVKAVTSPFALARIGFRRRRGTVEIDFDAGRASDHAERAEAPRESGQGAGRPAGAQARNRRACRPGERPRGIEARSPGAQGAGAETRGV
jgi:hypothetical protein